jgi:type I restriction enzyme, S subunit
MNRGPPRTPGCRMNKIEKLIEKLCPEGVEYKALGECLQKTVGGGTPLKSNSNFWDGNIPWASVKDVVKCGLIINKTQDSITEAGLKNSPSNIVPKEEIIIATRINPGLMVLAGIDVAINQDLRGLFLKNFLNKKFLIYYFQILKIEGKGTTVKGISIDELLKIFVPVPPLAIQQEIVNILDQFSELEAELEARKQQYEYYRDQLLTPRNVNGKWILNDGVEVQWKTLGEICSPSESIKWQNTNGTEFQYIDLSSVDRNCNTITETQTINKENAPSRAQQIIKTDDTIFGTTRPTLKRYCLITPQYDGQICSTGFCVLRPIQKYVLPKWIYYQISSTPFYDYTEKTQKGASYPSISDSDVKNYRIPLPPLAEQKRIVAILDNFNALVNDISEGLPAEINARRAQYEHYRNKLLEFKKKVE